MLKITIKYKSDSWNIDFDQDTGSIHTLREEVANLTGISFEGQKLILSGSKLKNTRKLTDGCTIGVLGNPINTPSIVNLKKNTAKKKKKKKGKKNVMKKIKRINPIIFAQEPSTSSDPSTSTNATNDLEPTDSTSLEPESNPSLEERSISQNPSITNTGQQNYPSSSYLLKLHEESIITDDKSDQNVDFHGPTQHFDYSASSSTSTSTLSQENQTTPAPLPITTGSIIEMSSTAVVEQNSNLFSRREPVVVLQSVRFPSGLHFSQKDSGRQRAKKIAQKFNSIPADALFDHMETLISEDRKSELVQHLNSVASLSRKEKIAAGVACYASIVSVSQLYSSGNSRLILESTNPFNFSSGTILRILHTSRISKADTILSNWHADLIEQIKTNTLSSSIDFPSEIGDMSTVVYTSDSRICLDVSTLQYIAPSSSSNSTDISTRRVYVELLDVSTTFKRRVASIQALRHSLDSGILKNLVSKSVLSMSFHPDYNPKAYFSASAAPKTEKLIFENTNLNTTQQDAVSHSLTCRPMALVHGPPGTGKTTTLVEIIVQLFRQKKRVLVCAASNTAVDNIVLRLLKTSVSENIIRLGSLARFDPDILSASFDSKLSDFRSRNRYMRKLDSELAKAQQKIISSNSKASRREARTAYKKIFKDWKTGQSEAAIDILESCPIILCTLTSVFRYFKLLNSVKEHNHLKSFDYTVIDEASQAIEIESWLSLIHSKYAILAGDFLQLAPTVISENALKGGLDCTLFDRLVEKYPLHSKMLTIQYRMNNSILKFSSSRFYNNLLKADKSVANHTLYDLVTSIGDGDLFQVGINASKAPLIFFDTSGCAMLEQDSEDSKFNPHEAEIVCFWVSLLTDELKIHPSKISIIAPYSAQRSHLRSCPELQNITNINTIDGFQGQENEVIIFSLTRSNTTGTVGFLADDRRLNVALTRAKRQFVLIGDSETISHNPFLEDLADFFTQNAIVLPGDAIRENIDLSPFFALDP